jgi:aspartate beta-hydroxylase
VQVKGLSAFGWRDDAFKWDAVRHLERNYERIKAEVLAVYGNGGLSRREDLETAGLHIAGEWRELNFLIKGRPIEKTMAEFPFTARVINGIPGAVDMVRGGSKISVMVPATVVKPHTGETNARLRIHLGLDVPTGVSVRVDGETRTWVEGKCICFDDSFIHQVWHTGTKKRIVLIIDVWHPEMTDAMKRSHLAEQSELLHVWEAHQALRQEAGDTSYMNSAAARRKLLQVH